MRIFRNFGTSCFNAIVLPFTRPIHHLARITDRNVEDRLHPFPRPVVVFCMAVFRPICAFCVSLAEIIDKWLIWPSQRATVYAALFGIPREEASRRVAEIDSKFHLQVLNGRCYLDALVAIVALSIAVVVGFLTWASAQYVCDNVTPDIKIDLQDLADAAQYSLNMTVIKLLRIAGGIGFFLAFGFLYAIRMTLRAVVDTTIICFYEYPDGIREDGLELGDQMVSEYHAGIGARAVVGDDGSGLPGAAVPVVDAPETQPWPAMTDDP
jgi:hypothetical protein